MTTFEKLIPPLERAVAALDKLDLEEAKKRLDRHQVKLVGSIAQNLGWLRTQKGDRPLTVEDLPLSFAKDICLPTERFYSRLCLRWMSGSENRMKSLWLKFKKLLPGQQERLS